MQTHIHVVQTTLLQRFTAQHPAAAEVVTKAWFGVDTGMDKEESGEFRFLKKKQTIARGRKEPGGGRQRREILSRGP